VGFCSVATGDRLDDVPKGKFQSRCGFLLRRDHQSRRHPHHDPHQFQSRCGFLLRRDRRESTTVGGARCSFNPGVGFCSVATLFLVRHADLLSTVSIPVWVSAPSRPTLYRRDHPSRKVSIPVWVSAPSRREFPDSDVDLEVLFQSRCGFLLRRDSPVRGGVRHERGRFNPGVGFCSVATVASHRVRDQLVAFQSRCGFLLRRDGASSTRSGPPTGCFNPGVGFCSVATWEISGMARPRTLFQSRCGFLLRRDPIRAAI